MDADAVSVPRWVKLSFGLAVLAVLAVGGQGILIGAGSSFLLAGVFGMWPRRSDKRARHRTMQAGEVSRLDVERRLTTLLSNLPGMAYRCLNDHDWTMEFVSDGAFELTGYRPEQLQHNRDVSFGRLIHPDDTDSVWLGVQDAVAERRPFQLTYRIRTATGGRKWVWEQGVGVFDDAGGLVALEGFIGDITEVKTAGDMIRRSEDRLRLALAAASQGCYDLDVRTGQADVSPEYALMLGFDHATFRESNDAWLERMHPADREAVWLTYRDYVAGLIPEYRVEFRQRAASGEWKWILSLGKIVERDAHGAAVRMLGTHTDITAQKRTEEEGKRLQAELLQAQKMESVGRLAGGVAHDFNNMLTVIIGHAEMALDDLDPTSPVHGQIVEIQAAARRSADLTRQLLGFARRQAAAPRVLDINETVAGTLKMLRRLIGEDIDLVWVPGGSIWRVEIDPIQLDQVLANLAVNARDAIAGVGTLTIETDNVTLDDAYCNTHAGAAPGPYVRLSVRDDGEGMPPEVQQHLFEPFFTTKGTGKGTGLGLATVYGIVTQNRGFITVASEVGSGTTFSIHLPRTTAHSDIIVAAAPADLPMARGETLLLVEDEPSVLRLGMAMLQRLGYTVLAAERPAEALSVSEAHTGVIDLLVTDMVMPEMNGRDLASRLMQARPGLARLFVSGYNGPLAEDPMAPDNGVCFLQKPYSIDALGAKVREALEATSRDHLPCGKGVAGAELARLEPFAEPGHPLR